MSKELSEMTDHEKVEYYTNLWNDQKSVVWGLEADIAKRDETLRAIHEKLTIHARRNQTFVDIDAIFWLLRDYILRSGPLHD